MKNTMAIISVDEGFQAIKKGGSKELTSTFHKARLSSVDLCAIEKNYMDYALIDVEQAEEIIAIAGSDAFSVFFLLESLNGQHRLSVSEIGAILGLTFEQAKEACYRLGLVTLAIDP